MSEIEDLLNTVKAIGPAAPWVVSLILSTKMASQAYASWRKTKSDADLAAVQIDAARLDLHFRQLEQLHAALTAAITENSNLRSQLNLVVTGYENKLREVEQAKDLAERKAEIAEIRFSTKKEKLD
jgi:hypothetical protein